VGLTNVRQRLALTCGSRAQLTLAPAAGGGCRAEIRIPLTLQHHAEAQAERR
jgi:sensor histidine kinase YesM